MGIYDRIETDNPLLDEIVYNLKLMMATTILKDEDRADKYETTASLRKYNFYDACVSGRAVYSYFDFLEKDFFALGLNDQLCKQYVAQPETIPPTVKAAVLANKSEEYIQLYTDIDGRFVDDNDYYRWLSGMPPIDGEYILLTKAQRLELNLPTVDLTHPIHEFPHSIRNILETSGMLTKLKTQYPEATYLNNYTKDINPYLVRKTFKYGKVYMDISKVEPTLGKRYFELLEKNRVYIQKTIDKYAMQLFSDYYARFIMMMIIIQAGVDLISELPDYYIRKDLFDIRTIEYFFEANGVEFFPGIPMKYQKRLVKNLNSLIKYKGTYINIIDITSLFGFSNVEIFKYYLFKERNVLVDGTYSSTGNIEEDYSLKFLKVDMAANADDAAKDDSNFFSYDTITLADKYWDGPYPHEYIKRKILEQEFNIIKSKYISIDTVYSIADMSFEMAYFNNMLMYTNIDKSRLTMSVPLLSETNQYNVVDLFNYLYSLMYLYNGVTDEIVTDPGLYLQIKGFNFNANLATLGTYVASKGFTLKSLGVDTFKIPASGFLSFSQLISVFVNNKGIYDHVIEQMRTVTSKKLYDIYSHIYNSLFLTSLNFNQYFITELSRPAETYKEYLYYKNRDLHDRIVVFEEILDSDDRKNEIHTAVNALTQYILEYFNNDNIKDIFANLPVESGEYIKNYMFMVINFFKSYMLDIMDIQSIYKLDKENDVRILDDLYLSYFYTKKEYVKIVEKMWNNAKLPRDEIIEIVDSYMLNSTMDLVEYVSTYIKEKYSLNIDLSKSDTLKIEETMNMIRVSIRHFKSSYEATDKISKLISIQTKTDRISIMDDKFIEHYHV